MRDKARGIHQKGGNESGNSETRNGIAWDGRKKPVLCRKRDQSCANGPYRTETWFNPGPGNLALRTGIYPNSDPAVAQDHGNYTYGMNHDSYVRPRWDEAYVFAYAASREWINAVRRWVGEVDPDFWTLARRYTITAPNAQALAFDEAAAYRLSEWVSTPGGDDGHWKGNGSGSLTEFAAFAAAWVPASNSVFVNEFRVRTAFLDLTTGLTKAAVPPGAVPAVPKIKVDRTAVFLRTFQVTEQASTGIFDVPADITSSPDYFARITVGGSLYVEAMQSDRAAVTPSWTVIHFVPTTTNSVEVHYELWDEDGANSEEAIDINVTAGKYVLDFVYDLQSRSNKGDIRGVHDEHSVAAVGNGALNDKPRAQIAFYITTRNLQ